MSLVEGRGFVLRSGVDGPWAGWLGLSQLDNHCRLLENPWGAMAMLGRCLSQLPGGLSLIWDAPGEWLAFMESGQGKGFLRALGSLPGLHLHFSESGAGEPLEAPLLGWVHAPEAPREALGLSWRQGWIGWVPQSTPGQWALPGFGHVELAEEGLRPGWLWGELHLPLAAVGEIDVSSLATRMAELQAGLELAMSHRISANAWPSEMPFHRRRAGWRVAFLGGREHLLSGADWESIAKTAQHFVASLETRLRCPIHPGVSHDPFVARLLGQQAMRDGLPWRGCLPLPPASPTFTPGLGADPRVPGSLEGRVVWPPAFQWLNHPPVVQLRVPSVPQQEAVSAFLRGQSHLPALWWLPPELPAPGPYLPERPWAPAGLFPPLPDVGQALQPGLFEGLE